MHSRINSMLSMGKGALFVAPSNDAAHNMRCVPGLPDFIMVCDQGFVYRNGKRIAAPLDKKGYPKLNTSIHGKNFTPRVHRLIALAFHGPCPDGYHVDHEDFDKTNNKPGNLRYMPPGMSSLRRRNVKAALGGTR